MVPDFFLQSILVGEPNLPTKKGAKRALPGDLGDSPRTAQAGVGGSTNDAAEYGRLLSSVPTTLWCERHCRALNACPKHRSRLSMTCSCLEAVEKAKVRE